MTSTQTDTLTPLAEAEAALAVADAAVKAIQRANGPTEEKFGGFQEALDVARQSLGADSKEATRALTGMRGLGEKVLAGRRELETAQRRRTLAAQRLESEQRAVTIARQAVANQQQRVVRQAEALTVARRAVAEKEIHLDAEQRMLRQLRSELQALVGDEDDTTQGAV